MLWLLAQSRQYLIPFLGFLFKPCSLAQVLTSALCIIYDHASSASCQKEQKLTEVFRH